MYFCVVYPCTFSGDRFSPTERGQCRHWTDFLGYSFLFNIPPKYCMLFKSDDILLHTSFPFSPPVEKTDICVIWGVSVVCIVSIFLFCQASSCLPVFAPYVPVDIPNLYICSFQQLFISGLLSGCSSVHICWTILEPNKFVLALFDHRTCSQ